VDQACVLVHANGDLHTKGPLIALLGLVHLGVPLPGLVLDGTGGGDQVDINYTTLSHLHFAALEINLVLLARWPQRNPLQAPKDPFSQIGYCLSAQV